MSRFPINSVTNKQMNRYNIIIDLCFDAKKSFDFNVFLLIKVVQ